MPSNGDQNRPDSGAADPEDARRDQVDRDQSTADLDQSSADLDQTSSDRDQVASELDQSRADAASSPPEGTPDQSADTERVRSQSTLDRDTSARARDEARQARTDVADDRDATAAADDREAAARDREAAARDRAEAAKDHRRAARDREAARKHPSAEGVDGLTGALLRQAGLSAILREIQRTSCTPEPLTVVFIDVDGLKVVNDTLGQAAGDDLLRDVARCLTRALGPEDIVMRYGGDEFVCAFSGQDPAGLRERFTRIGAELAELNAAATIGFAQATAEDRAEGLVERASQAMMDSHPR